MSAGTNELKAGAEMNWKWSNVPIPQAHATLLLLGVGLHLAVPWSLLERAWLGHVVGWPAVVTGLAIVGWCVATLRDMEIASATRLVVEGPYALSRNAMYVAWHLIFAGVGLIANAGWLCVLLPTVVVATHLVIVAEERQLAREFGDEYAAYAANTRRYFLLF